MCFEQDMSSRYSGKFFRKIYRNEDTGYCVYLFRKGADTTTVCGINLPEASYPVTFLGRYVNHAQYGRQFEVSIVMNQLPESRKDILSYISSMHIGIGKKSAGQLLEISSPETFWTDIAQNPEQFYPAIGKEKMDKLRKNVQKMTILQSLLQMFGNYLHMDAARYQRLCALFQDDMDSLLKTVAEDPFVLLYAGFRFHEVDCYCALRALFGAGDYRRLLGAATQVLLEAQSQCSAGVNAEDMAGKMAANLSGCGSVPCFECETFLEQALERQDLYLAAGNYYLPRSYDEESAIVTVLERLNAVPAEDIDEAAFADCISNYEGSMGLLLSQEQKNAIQTALTKSICIITGGPGTGKSTILDAICYCWAHFFPNGGCTLMAPTGRAAVRMMEVTGLPASTIHSALSLPADMPTIRNLVTGKHEITDGLVIVDESSMVDQSTAAALLLALCGSQKNLRQHMIFVGDPNQLPSVGYGNFLADMIASQVIPVCSLSNVYRQAADNPIIANSMKIKDGSADLLWTPSFRGYDNGGEEKNMEAVCQFYRQCIKAYGIENVALLSPYRKKTGISTNVLNERLQAAVNPANGEPFIKSGNRVFRLYDRVMMLKNTESLSNGDIGTITQVDPDAEDPYLLVRFGNGVEQKFPKEDLFFLDLAYAISIHKSQGGQFKVVLMVLPDHPSKFLRRDMVYTGITRAKENVAVFGSLRTLKKAIQDGIPEERITGLAKRLWKNT